MVWTMSTKHESNRLRVFRAEQRMTQFALSRKSRINPTRISFIENGHVEPTLDEQERIARALKAPVGDVFPAYAPAEAVR